MKLFIPEISTRIRLSADWTFSLHDEARNSIVTHAVFDETILEELRLERSTSGWKPGSRPFTLLSGSVLSVDRIYIRKGLQEYSSVTFNLLSTPDRRFWKKKQGGTFTGRARFWAKLSDVNLIEAEILPKVELVSEPSNAFRVNPFMFAFYLIRNEDDLANFKACGAFDMRPHIPVAISALYNGWPLREMLAQVVEDRMNQEEPVVSPIHMADPDVKGCFIADYSPSLASRIVNSAGLNVLRAREDGEVYLYGNHLRLSYAGSQLFHDSPLIRSKNTWSDSEGYADLFAIRA